MGDERSRYAVFCWRMEGTPGAPDIRTVLADGGTPDDYRGEVYVSFHHEGDILFNALDRAVVNGEMLRSRPGWAGAP